MYVCIVCVEIVLVGWVFGDDVLLVDIVFVGGGILILFLLDDFGLFFDGVWVCFGLMFDVEVMIEVNFDLVIL